MKVLLVNGSPNTDGCTFTALSEVENALHKQGISTELLQIGKKPVHGCIACDSCRKLKKCVFDGDLCNEISGKIMESDGVVIGSPVYFAAPNGALCALLDRVFYSSMGKFAHKAAACVVSCRRGGAAAAFDRLNKYFTIAEMHVVSSVYWNAVHGFEAEDVRRDLEGLQIMRTLGANMAWLIKSIKAGGPPPEREKRIFTNFMDGK